VSAISPSPDGQPQPVAAPGPAQQLAARVDERPEVAVGGAFVGGLVIALILKRLAR
jgi:hypothetical protein